MMPSGRALGVLVIYVAMGVTSLWLGFPLLSTMAFIFLVYLATGGWRFARVVVMTLPRDAKGLYYLIKVKLMLRKYSRTGDSIVSLFEKTAQRYPNKQALILVDGKAWTFQEMHEYSKQIASFLLEEGYRPGDTIALFMESRPEMVCWWLAMAMVSIVPALINFNLRKEALAHCINVAACKAVVYGTEMVEAIKEVTEYLSRDEAYMATGSPIPNAIGKYVDPTISQTSSYGTPKEFKPKLHDKLFYIYTSGTTGLPKAAKISHTRFFYMAYTVGQMFEISQDDVLYDILPLYHTAGGVLGIGQTLLQGTTTVIRSKFSASRFWDDCVKYRCTVSQYIGELCRYLLAQPVRPSETQHSVRMMFGNGIRPQIWLKFQQRFGIPFIKEFYGATEGNSNLLNFPGRVGAVGFTTRIVPMLYPVTLIKMDDNTGLPLRDNNGICIHCRPGEPGQLVGKISQGDPIRNFEGYVGQDETSKKIAKDVFGKGDMAFLSGDILEMDEYGFLYFKDRTGDTFRWRGENVSTAEVEETVHNILQMKDAVVYGVEVPGTEGRAGMVAIVDPEHQLNLDTLCRQIQLALPAYARPCFVRLLQKMDTTSTFKLQKKAYRDEGFNPNVTSDKLFYLDAKKVQYEPVNANVYADICSGKIRF